MADRLTRRGLAGLAVGGIGAAAIAAEIAGSASASGATLPAGPSATGGVATGREALKALDPRHDDAVYLVEGGRSGWFSPKSGKPPEDPREGLYLLSSVPGYFWQRDWDGVHGQPEWFGATTGDAANAADNRAAIQACLDMCAHTVLSGGIYRVDDTLVITRNGTRLTGAAHSQTDQPGNDAGRTSQIVSTNASATILRIGNAARSRPGSLTETVMLADFTVNRAVAPFTPASGFEGCIGIELRWIVNCHFVRVFSINSARGWLCYGTVENYLAYCGALRDRTGTNRGNDIFIGFHLDYSAPTGYNGGNASLYIDRCRCFPLIEHSMPQLTASYGIYLDKGWVDLWIDGFEAGGGITWGIYGIGTGAAAQDFRTENLSVRNCVLDPGGAGCIRLADAGVQTQVHITGNYMAPNGTGTGLVLEQVRGNVTVADNQFIVAHPRTGTGVAANRSEMVRLSGNSYVNLHQPIVLNSVTGFSIEDTIHSIDSGGDYPAVGLRGATRDGFVRCVLAGNGSAYSGGVFVERSVTGVEVSGSGIQQSAVGSGGRISDNGTRVTRTGPFGTGCIASGIMA